MTGMDADYNLDRINIRDSKRKQEEENIHEQNRINRSNC